MILYIEGQVKSGIYIILILCTIVRVWFDPKYRSLKFLCKLTQTCLSP